MFESSHSSMFFVPQQWKLFFRVQILLHLYGIFCPVRVELHDGSHFAMFGSSYSVIFFFFFWSDLVVFWWKFLNFYLLFVRLCDGSYFVVFTMFFYIFALISTGIFKFCSDITIYFDKQLVIFLLASNCSNLLQDTLKKSGRLRNKY